MELYSGVRVIQLEPWELKEFKGSQEFRDFIFALAKVMLEKYTRVACSDVQICQEATEDNMGILGHYTIENGFIEGRRKEWE